MPGTERDGRSHGRATATHKAAGFLGAGATVVVVGAMGATAGAFAPGQGRQAGQGGHRDGPGHVRRDPDHHQHHTLYIESSGTCTGGCLTIWPPLLMPKGKTKPAGVASGLGTTALGTRRPGDLRRQAALHLLPGHQDEHLG